MIFCNPSAIYIDNLHYFVFLLTLSSRAHTDCPYWFLKNFSKRLVLFLSLSFVTTEMHYRLFFWTVNNFFELFWGDRLPSISWMAYLSKNCTIIFLLSFRKISCFLGWICFEYKLYFTSLKDLFLFFLTFVRQLF